MHPLERRFSRRQVLRGGAVGAIGLGAAAFVGCGSNSENPTQKGGSKPLAENPQAGYKIYHGEAYEIEFPKDWSSVDTSSDPGEKETFIANGHFSNYELEDKSVYVNFRIEKLDPDETTIEDYKSRVTRTILRERGNEITGREKGIQESEGQKLLGQSSTELYYVVHFDSYDQKNLLRMRLMGRNVIRLKYSANSDNFEKYKPVFEQMASSLILK